MSWWGPASSSSRSRVSAAVPTPASRPPPPASGRCRTTWTAGCACCAGLNPSLHAADSGIGYVTPGNRFWPALRDTGLTELDRDPRRLLLDDRIGMTDVVKRATARAADLTTAEYRHGVERLSRLCAWLRPQAICFVGLA